jgi:hypothetical protein
LRRPPLFDLTQVDPSLLTQRGSGSQEPGENQQDGQDASGDSGGCACSRRRLRLPWLKGDSGRNGHYCTVPQVVRVSPGRENGTKRSLGVWAPAASCGIIYSSPQVREYQVRERSAPNTATADVSLTLRKNGIGGVKGDDGGAFAAHETAKKLGCMRPPPVRLGQVSEKGEVNRNPTCRILSSNPRSS